MSKDFSADNKPGKCIWCGRQLEDLNIPDQEPWVYFCSADCGLCFGTAAALNGFRLVKVGSRPPMRAPLKAS